jgi:ribosomal-protein-alanine N-acetyltransferase
VDAPTDAQQFALHGPTLTLRPPVPGDADALLALAGDAEVTQWFSWGPYTAIEQPLAYIEDAAARRARGEQIDLLIVHREQGPAGITGLSEFSARDRRCVVGTWFGRDFWGTGANRESKAIIAHLAFELLQVKRLGSYSNPANERSTRALVGVGFTHEGVLRSWHRHGDRYLDVNVFGMLREEWSAGELAQVPVRVEGDVPAAFASAAATGTA